MKILWVNPIFLDYRIPVYTGINDLSDGNFYILYSDKTPTRVSDAIKKSMLGNALELTGEMSVRLGKKVKDQSSIFANKTLSIPYQKGLLNKIIELKPDVIITEGFFQWSVAVFFYKIFNKDVKIILAYERTTHTERAAPLWRTFYRKFLCKYFIDYYAVNGRLTSDYLNSLGVKDEDILEGCMAADSSGLVMNSAKCNRTEEREKYNIPKDSFVYLSVGQLIERKGCLELLNAWRAFSVDNTILLFVGDGVQKEAMVSYIKENDINNVIILDHVDYSQMSKIYKCSDVLVSATLEDNWSLVVPEAMSLGLPIACSKYNGCHPELIVNNGILFDPLDIDDTVKMFNFFVGNQSLNYMSKESVKIQTEYTPCVVASRIFNFCSDIYNEKNSIHS